MSDNIRKGFPPPDGKITIDCRMGRSNDYLPEPHTPFVCGDGTFSNTDNYGGRYPPRKLRLVWVCLSWRMSDKACHVSAGFFLRY
jgi:hypothetical protein